MGDDLSVVNAAKVSFSRLSSWKVEEFKYKTPAEDFVTAKGHGSITHVTGHYDSFYQVRYLQDSDVGLIGYLARGCRTDDWNKIIESVKVSNNDNEIIDILKHVKRMPEHWTPFGHQTISITCSAPVPIRTQCFKHKQGFVENEESRRYITSRPTLFIPDEFRLKPQDRKQGSGGKHPLSDMWRETYIKKCETMIDIYEEMIEDDICPEQARFVLPQGVEVNWIWTGSLYAYANFYNKRTDNHSQLEAQQMAAAIRDIVAPLYPVSWKALTE